MQHITTVLLYITWCNHIIIYMHGYTYVNVYVMRLPIAELEPRDQVDQGAGVVQQPVATQKHDGSRLCQ